MYCAYGCAMIYTCIYEFRPIYIFDSTLVGLQTKAYLHENIYFFYINPHFINNVQNLDSKSSIRLKMPILIEKK